MNCVAIEHELVIMIKKLAIPGDLPDDRQLFLNHALQELNNNIKKDNDESKFLDVFVYIV